MALKKSKKNIRLKKTVDQLEIKNKAQFKAVAVKYDVDEQKAPKIIGFGKGKSAESIVKLAEESRIPFYEDPSLVELLSKLDIQSEIHPALYNVVAEVYRLCISWIYWLKI